MQTIEALRQRINFYLLRYWQLIIADSAMPAASAAYQAETSRLVG
ncbi:hypothetical protein [Paraburkholderia pallida]|nr:hypothetical protein [Paraburkholderia pallida]